MAMALSWAEAISALGPQDRDTVTALHNQLLAWGGAAALSAGSQPGQWKCEYKLGKPARALCVLRGDGAAWNLGVKLFHLGAYAAALAELTEPTRVGLLASGGCAGHGRCQGPVVFVYEEQRYALCRHGLVLRGLTARDLPGVMTLLAQERACRL